MEPVYMNMQSYPHQNGQVHYRPRCYSGMEARPPMSYQSWPLGSNCGYAPPGACHGCCNHAYMPAFCAWGGSPYSHLPPHHFPGNYPYTPVPYMPPPPYAMMNLPKYEYEQSAPIEHHFRECPNHPLHQKEQRNVRIEEEEPDWEGMKNDSLVPSQFKNSHYPISWLPADYSESGKVKSLEGRKDASSRDVKEHEHGKIVGQQLPFWNGWCPLDLNNVASSKERGDTEANSQQDSGKPNFQFPFFWIPCKPYDPERENQKLKDVDAKPSLESEKGTAGDQKFHVNGGNIGDHSASRVKDIPVKEVEHVGRESSINMEKEEDTTANIGTGGNRIGEVEKVSPVEGSKKKSPSPPKSSKLPPVCLRVDPLPRKKSAIAKSQSPTPIPPGDKQKLEMKPNEAVKVKECTDTKTIAVVDRNTSLEKSMVNVETPGKPPAKSNDVSKKQAEENPQEEITRNHSESYAVIKEQSEDIVSTRGQTEESFMAEEMKTDAGNKCSKRELSEEEAAVIIQSAYRCFDVRRWKPIEKLKQIATVRKEIAGVKSLIREMELCSGIQRRAKQKNIISETIMSLLLKLDTIQGLHPSIREVRKSVVKELVSLQEHLGTIMNEKTENSPGEEPVIRHDQKDSSSKSEDVVSSENSNKINQVDLQNQIEGGSNPERAECPEANLIDEAAGVETGVEAAKSSADEGFKSAQGTMTEDEDEKRNEVLEHNETSIAKKDCEAIILGQGSELSSLLDDSARETNLVKSEERETFQSELAELPKGILHELCAAEGTNHPAVEADSSKAGQSKQLEEPAAAELPQGVLDDLCAAENANHAPVEADLSKADQPQQLEELAAAELPQGVLDDLGAAEGTNHSAVGADSSKSDESQMLKEAFKGSPIVRESHYGSANEENYQIMETHEVSDLPLDGYELETRETGKGGSLENYKLVDSESKDPGCEANECIVQQLTADHKIEPSEAPDEREVLVGGENISTNDVSHENLWLTDSRTEEPPTEKETSGQLPRAGNTEETGLAYEHTNSCDAASMVGAENPAAVMCIVGQGSADINHWREVSEMGVLSKQGEECNPPLKEAIEKPLGDAAEHEENTAAGDEMRGSSRELREEKEQLRLMLEQLIKAGQEQLTVISSLSGRVKDLEKRLSRKKKLKVKQSRVPRYHKI